MNTTRIAYLISQYPAVSMVFILREIRTLRQLGFDIKVASINRPDRDLSELTTAEQQEENQTYYIKAQSLLKIIKIHGLFLLRHPLRYGRGLGFALRLAPFDFKKGLYNLFYFAEAIVLGQWMQQHQLSHVHVHIPMSAATVALIARQSFPIRFSMTVHGPNEFYDAPGYYLATKIQQAAFICCISHFARSQLMAFASPTLWSRLELSRLGVDPSLRTPNTFRQQPNPFELLCVGRLVPVKGQFILLQAVTQLLAQQRSLRLRLVGNGPDRHGLEAEVKRLQLSEHIIFEGAVNEDRVFALYTQTDIFVLASFAEGIPVVLMEAMMMAIPCITTHITGIPELIQANEEGLLVPPADTQSLAEAIALLMDNPELRQRLAQAGRQKVLNAYELKQNTQTLAAIFQRRLAEHRV